MGYNVQRSGVFRDDVILLEKNPVDNDLVTVLHKVDGDLLPRTHR
jgi:hypothetical protein